MFSHFNIDIEFRYQHKLKCVLSFTHLLDNQQTVHLRCHGLADNVAQNYWKGLEFYNSTSQLYESDDVSIVKSASVLEFVDIFYAGVDEKRLPVPAVRASPHPPSLMDCNILYSALDGTNFSYAKTETVLKNSVIAFSRGMLGSYCWYKRTFTCCLYKHMNILCLCLYI